MGIDELNVEMIKEKYPQQLINTIRHDLIRLLPDTAHVSAVPRSS